MRFGAALACTRSPSRGIDPAATRSLSARWPPHARRYARRQSRISRADRGKLRSSALTCIGRAVRIPELGPTRHVALLCALSRGDQVVAPWKSPRSHPAWKQSSRCDHRQESGDRRTLRGLPRACLPHSSGLRCSSERLRVHSSGLKCSSERLPTHSPRPRGSPERLRVHSSELKCSPERLPVYSPRPRGSSERFSSPFTKLPETSGSPL